MALAVFSIAVLALLNAQGEHVRAASAVQAKAIAQIVAENRLIETMATRQAPQTGVIDGEVEMAGRLWRWQQRTRLTDNDGLLRIEVDVRRAADSNIVTSLTGFRRLEGSQ